jgi:hypothetical protein
VAIGVKITQKHPVLHIAGFDARTTDPAFVAHYGPKNNSARAVKAPGSDANKKPLRRGRERSGLRSHAGK